MWLPSTVPRPDREGPGRAGADHQAPGPAEVSVTRPSDALAAVTAAYASWRGWTVAIPAGALAGGVGVALAVGAHAGLYPAARAARLSPADAVRPS
jgi:hypothetical protein